MTTLSKQLSEKAFHQVREQSKQGELKIVRRDEVETVKSPYVAEGRPATFDAFHAQQDKRTPVQAQAGDKDLPSVEKDRDDER